MQRINVIGLVAVVVTAVVSVGAVSVWKGGSPFVPLRGTTGDRAAAGPAWLTLDDSKVNSSELTAAATQQKKELAEAVDMQKKAPFTALYLADLPPETPNSEVLNKEKIEQFAEAHLGDAWPALPEKAVLGTVSNDPESIKHYFATVLPQPEGKLQPIGGADITAVLQAKQEGGAQLLTDLTQKIKNNLEELQKAPVPSALLALHTQYMQATTGLLASLRLLATAATDPVAGLIAQKQLQRQAAVIDDLNHQLRAAQMVDYSLTSPTPTP